MLKYKLTKNVLIILIATMFVSCKSYKPLYSVEKLDIEKYCGTWYEIARFPNKFEKDMEKVSATYSMKENGNIKVINRGYNTKKKKEKEAIGTAWRPNKMYEGRLKVRFFWPFAGDYYVIHLGENYDYALIGEPSRKYLWILAKSKSISKETYNLLVGIAKENGFDVTKLEIINQ